MSGLVFFPQLGGAGCGHALSLSVMLADVTDALPWQRGACVYLHLHGQADVTITDGPSDAARRL